jgi:glycerophosphoryl diester phosphodiesterase
MSRVAAPLVVAHRGASSIAPENTLEAFAKAIDVGADMVEFDVRATADRVLVAFHDAVGEWTYAELCERLPHRPPRLDEVVDLCAGGIALDVELKERGSEDEVLRVVSAKFAPESFVVTSFLGDVAAAAKRLRPDVRVGLLLARNASLPVAGSGDFLATHYTLVDRGLVPNDVHTGIVVWTVNDEERLRRYLADERVAAVITDDPELALSVRANRRGRDASDGAG